MEATSSLKYAHVERTYILALHLRRGVGPKTVRKVLSSFPTFEALLEGRERLKALLGEAKAKAVLSANLEEAEREMERAERLGVRVLTLADPDYPEGLKGYDVAPPVLYVKGDISILGRRTVAVVGTRYPSEDAKVVAFELGKGLAEAGATVVSGGAYGIDTQAHRGAIAGGGGTAVVLGSGIDRPYPRENRGLFAEVVERGGVLLSEFPLGTPPNPGNFPARNRVISALSDVVVVVQAPSKSGALITASWALEQGKDVWAVPFSPLDRRAYGSNRLIYDGAKPIYDIGHFIEDVLDAPLLTPPAKERGELDEAEAFILDLLREPLHVDEIAYRSGMPISRLYTLLLTLQMKGYVRELPGKLYEAVP